MACSGCRKKRSNTQMSEDKASYEELYATGNYVFVRYEGPLHTHTVGSPTGIIKENKLTDYGRSRKGHLLLVHKKDAEKRKDLFVPVIDGLEEILKQFGIKEVKEVRKEEEKEPVKPVLEQAVNHNDTDENEQSEIVEKVVEVKEGEGLTKDNAMLLADYSEANGYTHYLQVVAKVKSGELFSYKNDEGKTMIYEREGE